MMHHHVILILYISRRESVHSGVRDAQAGMPARYTEGGAVSTGPGPSHPAACHQTGGLRTTSSTDPKSTVIRGPNRGFFEAPRGAILGSKRFFHCFAPKNSSVGYPTWGGG